LAAALVSASVAVAQPDCPPWRCPTAPATQPVQPYSNPFAPFQPAPATPPAQEDIFGVTVTEDFFSPLTLSLASDAKGRQIVYFYGEIGENSAGQFDDFLKTQQVRPGSVVAMHSPGGVLEAGLQIGRSIRAHSLRTTVAIAVPGAIGQQGPGACVSACSMAFLGGVERTVPQESRLVVHTADSDDPQYNTIYMGQVAAAETSAYLSEMGVSQGLLNVMIEANSSVGEVKLLTPDVMSQLHVTTTFSTAWSELIRGVPLLIGDNGSVSSVPGAHDQLMFACSNNLLFLNAFYVTDAPRDFGGSGSPPAAFAGGVTRYALSGLIPGPAQNRVATVLVAPTDVTQPAKVLDAHRIQTTLRVTPEMIDLMSHSDILGVQFGQPVGVSGVLMVDFKSGRGMAQDFFAACPRR
jgi:hypothetical protein